MGIVLNRVALLYFVVRGGLYTIFKLEKFPFTEYLKIVKKPSPAPTIMLQIFFTLLNEIHVNSFISKNLPSS